jgi:hypothetical protein
MFDKDAKAIQWRKDNLSTNGGGTTGYAHFKKCRHRPYKLHKEINSKWVIRLKHKMQNYKIQKT